MTTLASLPVTAQTHQELKENLARAYYILANLGMDDLTYTHVSVRVPGEEAYYIYPLGLFYEEVRPDNLLKVSFGGKILEGNETSFNITGYTIHSTIYKARSDLNALIHIHTIPGVSVSCLDEGLLPISQFSYHFYERMAYHGYDALTLDPETQGSQLVKNLSSHKCMMLKNHGTLTAGATLHEALFYTLFLEKACQVQLQVLASGRPFTIPSHEVCVRARDNMTAFESDIGLRDWLALVRTTKFPWES